MQRGFDPFGHHVKDRGIDRAKDPFGQLRKRFQPELVVAGRAGDAAKIVQHALANLGPLRERHDRGRMGHQRPRQPERAARDQGQRRACQDQATQAAGAGNSGLNGAVHRLKRGDHVGVLKFEAFPRIKPWRKDRREGAPVQLFHRWQRPVAKRGATFRIDQDQGRIAKADMHFAALIMGRLAPQAKAFESLILFKRRHRLNGPWPFAEAYRQPGRRTITCRREGAAPTGKPPKGSRSGWKARA